MQKELYKKLMLETSKKIEPTIFGYLKPLKKENEELYDICSELLKKKIGTFETRAYLLRISFEACAGKKWTQDIMHACVAIELELASVYYTNRIFDDKGGKEILSQPNNQFIAAMITRDLASQALTRACRAVDYKTFVKIKDLFDEINKVLYIGQFLDINVNLYKPKMNFNFDKMLNLYYRTNDGFNNSFFEKLAMIGGILGNGTERQIKALGNFGRNYGMALQIINDIGDFVPPEDNAGTDEKIPDDSYSDIKHRKLTLPIIYTLTKGSNEEREIIIKVLEKGKRATIKELRKITEILVNNGAIAYSQNIVRDFIHKAKSCLSVFKEKDRNLIEGVCFIGYSNRYYKALRKFKKA
ncbi:MAG: polyprenyl synthetase family protein [Patescibacteria group bacterium]